MKVSLSMRLTGFILVIGLGIGLMALRGSQTSRLTPSNLFNVATSAAQSPGGSNTPSAAPGSIQQTKARAVEAYGKLPISFEANQGQTDKAVKFLARGSGYGLFLTPTEAVLTLRGQKAATTSDEHTARQSRTAVLRMKLAGANPAPLVSGLERLPRGNNYFLGSDPKQWRTNTPSFAKVKYEQVYKGVDLIYYGNQRQLEYDFVLAPAVSPEGIKMEFKGAERVSVDESGSLVIDTAGGEVRQHAPLAYQTMEDGSRQFVAARYVVDEHRAEVGFEVAQHDAARPLVIDPVLAYSTFLGGADADYGRDIAVDSNGNAYVAGITRSLNFPTSPGAVQSGLIQGDLAFDGTFFSDIFITKLNPAGSAIVYSTYLGGDSQEESTGIAVDDAGNVYVAGSTYSQNFPTTAGAYQMARAGDYDGFVLKLNETGTGLIYSTYLGGPATESMRDIAIDAAGNAVVVGQNRAGQYPTTAGSFQPTFPGNPSQYPSELQAYVTKLNAQGTALIYSTYLGGTNTDTATGVKLDADGNAFVIGYTGSADFPVTPGAFQTTYGSGGDAFASKLSADGSTLLYSTYLGGSSQEQGNAIALDGAGNIYLTGNTSSMDFPVTPGAYQTAYGRSQPGGMNAFLTKLNPNSAALIYSTYLGRDIFDSGNAIAIDRAGNAIIAGYDFANGFPQTTDAVPTPNGNYSGFITKFNYNATALLSSTKFGISTDGVMGLALDSAGSAYVTGYTWAPEFNTTPGAYQTTHGGGFDDAFVAKLNYPPPPDINGKIAFTSERDGDQEIYVMDADGTHQTNISNNSPAAWNADSAPAWSPDGSKIVFMSNRDAYSGLYVMNADGTGVVAIPNAGSSDPAWSPDGTKIAFMSNLDIYTVNVDGTNPVRLTSTVNNTKPTWSPDGTKIAFESWRADQSEIYVMNQDGSNMVRLTTTTGMGAYDPAWSPDGSKIVFHSYRTNFEIFTMDPQGGHQTRLTNNAAEDFGASWSPDGSKIVFTSMRDGSHEIYVMNADGSNQTRLTEVPFKDYSPAWQRAAAPTPTPTPTPTPAPTPAELYLYSTVNPYQVESGGTVTYVSNVTNNGPGTATNARLSQVLPTGVSVTNIDNSYGACTSAPDSDTGGTRVTCPLGDIASGGTSVTTITATATGTPYNWMQAVMSVESDAPENTLYDNYSYPGFSILGPPEANLYVDASAQPGVVASGGTVEFRGFVYNYGPYPAAGATLTATLPAGFTVNAASTVDGACTVTPTGGATTVTCPLGDINVYSNQTATINATVTAANGANLQASMAVTSNLFDSNTADNTGAPLVIVRANNSGPGGKLAFVSYRDGNAEIYTANADGSNALNLTNNSGYDWEPAWSPDGSKLVFSSDRSGTDEVWVMNADGSNPVQLTTNGSSGVYFAWSPDGTKILWQDYQNGNYDICVINADGTNYRNLTNDTIYQDRPTWSPSGSKIMYEDYGESYTSEVFVINADGTGKVNLTNTPDASDYSPVWSPDGTKIAFARGYGSPELGIYVMNADGTNQVSLTNTESDAYPSWSPDGTKIAFSRYLNYTQMIYVMNADGSSQSPAFTENYSGGARPEWSSDSKGLTFSAYRDGNSEIYVVNPDGSGLTNVSQNYGYDFEPRWRPVAIAPVGDTPAGTNVTVTENGVAVTFSNVTTAGETTVTPIDPNSLQGIPGEYVINANSLAFEIHTTAAYTGPITLGFQVPGITNPITFSTLRVLHGEPPPVPNFVDRTVLSPGTPSPDFATRTIYARVTSLSPFLVAERREDSAPPDIQINAPVNGVYLLNQQVTAAYACSDSGSGIAECIGAVANGAALNTSVAGSFTFTVNARDNAGNTSTATVNYSVAYKVNPLFDQTKASKSGSTIPIKLELKNSAGVNQSASGLVVTALGITRISDNAPGALADSGSSNPDYNFRFSGGSYIYNLKTTGYATGTYLLSFKAGSDPVTHTVQFQVK